MAHIIHAKIQSWGNGPGLRVAGLMRDIPHFTPDTAIQVEVSEEGLTSDTVQAELLATPFAAEVEH